MPALVRLGCLFALLSASFVAQAQPSEADRRNAQMLFDRGRALMDQGRFGEACPLFGESHKLDPGGGTILNLALCHEKEGRLATAHAEYNDALSAAIRDGRPDRKELAEERIAALGPKIPKLRLELPAEIAELTIDVDGAEIPRLAWAAPLPVDPGKRRVTARAPGHREHTEVIEIGAGQEKRVVIARLVPEREPAVAPISPIVSAAPPPERASSRPTTAAFVVGGAGAVLLGVSAVTGILALRADGKADDAAERADCLPERDFCRDPAAADESKREADRARSLAWISTATLVVGAGAVVTALLLPREQSKNVAVGASAGKNQAAVSLSIAWPRGF